VRNRAVAFVDEYNKSLKNPAAEEIFDLILFRPLAYLFVKGIYRFQITPNQLTALSVALGLLAAVAFAASSSLPVLWGAILYASANLLDCADGQLARLQRSGTPFGRVWDGMADYLSGIAVFIGIGVGFGNWWLVVAAGISSAIHATVFDSYQSKFLAALEGKAEYFLEERRRYEDELQSLRINKRMVRALCVLMYLQYVSSSEKLFSKMRVQTTQDSATIRSWSFLGPTTNRTVLIVSALFGQITFFLWAVAIGGNLWLMVCLIARKRSRTS
jgi:phosphatidylglycerophosphate synthase